MKKTFAFLLVCFCSAFSAEYSDNFNRESLGAGWTTIPNAEGLTIRSSDTLSGTVNDAYNGAYYTSSAYTDSQYVSAKIYFASTSIGYTFVAARVDSLAQTMYAFGVDDNYDQFAIYKYLAGSEIKIASGSLGALGLALWATGDSMAILARHDTIIGYKNNLPLDTVVDTDIDSGRCGVFQYRGASYIGHWDNFHAWDNSGGAPPACTDSITYSGIYDSSATELMHLGVAECGGSVWSIFQEIGGARDSVSFGAVDSGDTIRDTIVGLTPSTQYRLQLRLDAFLTGYDTAWTEESIDACDSVHQVGFVDSLPTRLIYKATVGCTTTDTIRTVWGEDTTALDTNYHAGTFSAGDTIRDTMTSLMPSTKYYAASIDSMFKTAYASAWTTDSIDSTEIEVTGYTLTVNNDGHGSTDPSGATDVDSGAGTAISASASSHYHFLNWSVTSGTGVTFSSTTSASSACTLKVESATIQANFGIDTFHIANTITGGHATIAYGTDSIAAYAEPCSLFLTVESGYLANWPGGNDITGGKDTLVVVAAADSTVAVTVRAWPQYNLTVSNDGHGNTSPSGITAVDSAASTPLSATSGTGYGFVNWTVTSGSGYAFGDADDSTTTIALSSGNVAIQANFDLDTFYVARNPGANGAMSTDDADTIYAYGESARVIITPDPGYRIVGNQDSLPDTLQFTVTKDTTVSATFEAWPTFTVDSTIVNGRPDSVIFSDYGSVDSGKTITVTIHNPADTQCTVSGDTSGILTGFTDVVNANKSYVFTFDEIPDTAPPTMVTSPAQVHDSLGETDTVFAAATGGGTITYQWQFYSGGWSDTAVTNDSLFYLLTLAKAGDSCRCIAVNDYGADTSSAFAIVVHYSPVVIDSLRPNPVYRLDSCTIYLKSARSSGTVTVLQLDTVLTPKYYSDTQIDIYTGDWARGWYDIEVTNNLGLKDTGYLRIVVPRKTN
jgi:hypothetical protein